jgi:hypothetical protein
VFDVVEVEVLPRYFSDHSPLLISLDRSSKVHWRKKIKDFILKQGG